MRWMRQFVASCNFPRLGAACPKTTGIAAFASFPTRSSTPGIPREKSSLFRSFTKAGNRFPGSAICNQPFRGPCGKPPAKTVRTMPDVFTKSKRSEVMSRIRSRGNKDTELELTKLFRANGITGWRRNAPVFGKPDFVFRKGQVAVFVDGCYWHGCPKHATRPRTNAGFPRRATDFPRTRR